MSRTTSPVEAGFVGRLREREALTEAVCQEHGGVIVVRGGPGTGKSALISRWLGDLQERPHRFQRIFAGSACRSANARSPQSLLERLIDFLPPDGDECNAPPVDRLLHALRRHPTLIVLDGIDEFATAFEDAARGSAESDLGLWLRECGRTGASRVVVTSRVPLETVQDCGPARSIPLGCLSSYEGAELLHTHGVRGARRGTAGPDDPELQAAAEELGGHPLGLTLLARFLVQVHDGDVRRRTCMPLRPGARSVSDLVTAFERWFDDGPEQELLSLMALTRGLATRRQLRWLASQPRLRQSTGNLSRLTECGWEWALRILHDCGLVKLRDDQRISIPRLVQDCVRQRLERHRPGVLEVRCPAEEDVP